MTLPSPTERENVRREATGYADDTELLDDASIDYYWETGGAGSVLLTAALCCEMLAARAGGVDVLKMALGDGVAFDMQMHPDELRLRADELRRRAFYGEQAAARVSLGTSTAVRGVWADAPTAFGAEAVPEFGG